jgi:1,4-dihydroxy-2-naphthoate polyprenyltransferase
MKNLIVLIRMIRPLYLISGLVLYTLGAGIARYLGEGLEMSIFLVGSGWVIAMQLATHLLHEYYAATPERSNPNRTGQTGGSGAGGEGQIPPRSILFLAFACLAVVAMLTVVIIDQVKPESSTYLIMAIGFLGGFFYSTPPVRLENTGYGEFTAAFLMGFLIPAYAFSLQAQHLDRLVLMVSFPLVVLALGTLIALELPDYQSDLRRGKRTLTVRLDWKVAMNLHNVLILAAYLLIGVATIFGLPRFIALAAMLSLPAGFLQVWQMWRIGQGGKPNWNALTINAASTFGLMIYLITYALWTH